MNSPKSSFSGFGAVREPAIGSPAGPAAGWFGPAFRTALLFLLPAGLVFGAAPPASPALSSAELAKLISLIGPDYKKAQELPDTFFNPFKIETTVEFSGQKKSSAVTEQAVAEAVGRKGVSGVIYAANIGMSQVIIGDQVFRVGDELDFPDGESGASVPLISGANVVLREVSATNLVFDFSSEGEAAHRSTFSLRNFWRP